jgi:ribosomal protein S18 acetylase RimI-like enzyme
VVDVSPLDYTPLGFSKGSVERVALVDTEAPPIPTKVSAFFAPRYATEQRKRAPKGHPQQGQWITKALKKPKLVDPGAPPNTVAFIDYKLHGPNDAKQAYVFYMATRSDLRGRKYGRDLLERFMLALQAGGIKYVNFGKVLNETMWRLMRRWVDAHDAGTYAPHVRGKHHF